MRKRTVSLTDLEAGTNTLTGFAGKVLVSDDNNYVELLADPIYNQTDERWEALARVNNVLAIVEVSAKWRQPISSS